MVDNAFVKTKQEISKKTPVGLDCPQKNDNLRMAANRLFRNQFWNRQTYWGTERTFKLSNGLVSRGPPEW